MRLHLWTWERISIDRAIGHLLLADMSAWLRGHFLAVYPMVWMEDGACFRIIQGSQGVWCSSSSGSSGSGLSILSCNSAFAPPSMEPSPHTQSQFLIGLWILKSQSITTHPSFIMVEVNPKRASVLSGIWDRGRGGCFWGYGISCLDPWFRRLRLQLPLIHFQLHRRAINAWAGGNWSRGPYCDACAALHHWSRRLELAGYLH